MLVPKALLKSECERALARNESWVAPDEAKIASADLVGFLLAHSSPQAPTGTLKIRGFRFEETLDLSGLRLNIGVSLESCTFAGDVVARGARLSSLRLTRSKICGELDARGCTLDGSLELNRTKCRGPVRMDFATVGGWLDCTCATFGCPDRPGVALSANGLRVTGDVLLCAEPTQWGEYLDDPGVTQDAPHHGRGPSEPGATKFTAYGLTRMPRARIGGQLECTGGEFLNRSVDDGTGVGTAIFADAIEVTGRAHFGEGFRAEGQVNFRRAEVGGQFRFEGTIDVGVIDCEPSPTGKPPPYPVALNLEAAYIRRALSFRPQRRAADGQYIRRPICGVINLINVRAGYLADADENTWIRGGHKLRGLAFGPITGEPGAFMPEQPRLFRMRLARPSSLNPWLLINWRRRVQREKRVLTDRLSNEGRASQAKVALESLSERIRLDNRLRWIEWDSDTPDIGVYTQLAEHYRRIGHDDSERRVLVARHTQRRKLRPWGPHRLGGFLADRLLGYGYYPWRIVVVWLALVAIGWIYFNRSSVLAHDLVHGSPHFHSLVYSLDLLLPVIDLGERSPDVPRPGFPADFSTTLVIAGWVLATLFIALLGGAIRLLNRP